MTKKVTITANNKTRNKDYNSFIRGLDIKDIRLISATIENIERSYMPSEAVIKWRIASSYENKENRIEVIHRYNVRVLEKDIDLKAKIKVVFCVTYESKTPMNDDYFERFKTRNLPLNTWPYFREYIHNSLSRMGWPSFVAPAFVTQS